jgi:hypothetical protein
MSTTKVKSKEGLLSLFCGEKVVMRSILVAAVAAACVLLVNVASADCSGNQGVRRPLVTVAPISVDTPVLIVEVAAN